jgi:hypothetical protein
MGVMVSIQRLTVNGKPDFKTCFAGLGLELDFTAVSVGHYAIADNQSKASAWPNRFCRKERLKQVGLNVNGNAGTVVHEFNGQLIALAVSSNTDLAGAVDGINRVVNEIGPYLVEFTGVSHDARNGAIKRPVERRVFQFMTRHQQRALDAFVNINLLHWRLAHVGIRLHGFNQFGDSSGALFDLAQLGLLR